jgi:hypothetical protein
MYLVTRTVTNMHKAITRMLPTRRNAELPLHSLRKFQDRHLGAGHGDLQAAIGDVDGLWLQIPHIDLSAM